MVYVHYKFKAKVWMSAQIEMRKKKKRTDGQEKLLCGINSTTFKNNAREMFFTRIKSFVPGVRN